MTELPCTDETIVGQEVGESPINPNRLVPVIQKYQCGLDMNCKNGECEIKASAFCSTAQKEYLEWLNDPNNTCEVYDWQKDCNVYGGYEAIQAKTNVYNTVARRWCSDFYGERIFGEADFGDEDIKCDCSRKYWELRTFRNVVFET